MFTKIKGQTILEYVLLITVVLLAAIYGVSQVIKAKTEANMDAADTLLTTANTELKTATQVD